MCYPAMMRETKRICAEANVPYKGEHVFRHTFATNKYNNKMDIKILSRMLGHSSTSVTYDIYVNLYGDGFDAMQEAISGM